MAQLIVISAIGTDRTGVVQDLTKVILACGGTAYLAKPMVNEQLRKKQLFQVKKAPIIKRIAYGVYPINCGRRPIIEKTLSYFSSIKARSR